MRRCSTKLSCSPHSARSICNILSLTPTVTAGWSSRFLRIQSAGTGWGRTPASPLQEAHGERDLIHTSYTGGGADREPQWYQVRKAQRIRAPKSCTGWGHFWRHYLCKSIPSSRTPKQQCLYFSLTFLGVYKDLFSFPHPIPMIHPARRGIL